VETFAFLTVAERSLVLRYLLFACVYVCVCVCVWCVDGFELL
jgi:hypothetical protein